jgi:hypothetical protein
LRLPAELRNKIYVHAFTGAVVKPWLSNALKDNEVHGCVAFSLFTCRQLRYETSALFFSHVAFDFRSAIGESLIQGAHLLGAQIRNKITFILLDAKTICYHYLWEDQKIEDTLERRAGLPALQIVRVFAVRPYGVDVLDDAKSMFGPQVRVMDDAAGFG